MPRASRPAGAVDASAKARLLRRAAVTAPLWIVARGGSMGWTIPTGCEVLVSAASRPRRGQLWAYCDEAGGLVVHRYRRVTGSGHVLQGDRCGRPDPPVDGERLVGRVTAVQHGGRVRRVSRVDRLLGACQRVPRVLIVRTAGLRRRLPRRTR